MSEQNYIANFYLTGLTKTEYQEVIEFATKKIGKVVSFGGGIDNIDELRKSLLNKINTDLIEIGISEEKRQSLIEEWGKFIF